MMILIADDEAPARGELRFMLEALEPETDLLEARNGEEALEQLAKASVDVAFLDINMPGASGLAVAAEVLESDDPPLIVFATAYDEHAARAFDLAALDYVVKPFDETRLAATLTRVRQALSDRDLRVARQDGMRAYLNTESAPLSKLWAELENENRVLLDFNTIYWFSADGGKVYAHTARERLLVRYTLKELEALLADHAFARAHKGTLLNLNHISEVVPWFSGNYLVRMRDAEATELNLSRRYAAQLKELTGWR